MVVSNRMVHGVHTQDEVLPHQGSNTSGTVDPLLDSEQREEPMHV